MPIQLLFNGSTIRPMKLLDFLKWAKASFDYKNGPNLPEYGVLRLPAIQRDLAWKADQVVNLWDSVLRGLPLGALMVQHREAGQQGRGTGNDARIEENLPEGWDLLDGQQRLRSLLLGLYGPQFDQGRRDLRCVWIDLRDEEPKFIMTSASQPFGYNKNGYKLGVSERRRARKRYESDEPIQTEIRLGKRIAYTHELFENFCRTPDNLSLSPEDRGPIPPENHPQGWPPLPHGIQPDELMKNGRYTVIPLHVLLHAWIHAQDGQGKSIFGLIEEKFIQKLQNLFTNFDNSEIALINATNVAGHQNTLKLYDRIGAGGTPLSNEDRLFSIYKSIRPDFHNLALGIFENIGRIMSPSKIAVCAIRIANARLHANMPNPRSDQENDAPNVIKFIKIIDQNNNDPLVKTLDEICPKNIQAGGLFFDAFSSIYNGLKYNPNAQNGLPKSMLSEIPVQTIQVLLFWKIQTNQDFDNNHLSRFVVGWILVVNDNDELLRWCFENIRKNSAISLSKLFCLITNYEKKSLMFLTPDQMHSVIETTRSHEWLDKDDRWSRITNPSHPHKLEMADTWDDHKRWRAAEFAKRWWKGGNRYLPWLQRAYLVRTFPDYDPTADLEQDKPYDFDHICPANDFYYSPWYRADGLTQNDLRSMIERERDAFYISIGNLRLINFSENRGDGDADISEKIPPVMQTGNLTLEQANLLKDWAFPDAESSRALWRSVSRPGPIANRLWSKGRLADFQSAVEQRAAWLYEKLYTELGFAEWLAPEQDETSLNP